MSIAQASPRVGLTVLLLGSIPALGVDLDSLRLFETPEAGSCTNNSGPVVTGAKQGNLPDSIGPEDDCARSQHCFPPQISLIAEPASPGCDPWAGACTYRVGADIVVPENTYRIATQTTQRTFWFAGDSPPTSCPPPPSCVPMAYCGEWQFGQQIDEDKFRTYVSVSFSCADPLALSPQTYSLLVSACYLQSCQRSATQVLEIDPTALFQWLCRPPRKEGCPEDGECKSCVGPGGSVGAGGDGPGFGGEGTGPGARLRYVARGAGTAYTPGWETWRVALGRNWSHDYAQRIFLDPVEETTDHVWLITGAATFREFWSPGVDGLYAERSPLDEYRKLELLPGGGWVLHELDGREHEFDAGGRWIETRDSSPSGNATTGSYDVLGQLETVTFAEGRSESFTYHADGKLATITEVGVGGAENRLWRYSWSGHDLRLLRRPDGSLYRFEYADPRHPGYLTRVVLVGIDLDPGDNVLPPERALRAYAYDDYGNVVQAWTGAATFATGFERYAFSHDDAAKPTATTMTVTIDTAPATEEVVVYHLDRPTGETKPRITHVDGSCPGCGSGANTRYFFEDAAHPYLPTLTIDGNGVETELEYDGNGRLVRRIDAANNPDADSTLPRETSWEYHADFPALVTAEIGPTTLGVTATRRVDSVYDGTTADLLSRTLSGEEATFDGDGSFTPLVTLFAGHNAAGRVETIDPPGHASADQTAFTYDASRGSLLPSGRTDPLQGTTAWTYTAFNKIESVTDAQGVRTDFEYDEMHRPTRTLRRGPEDLTEGDDLVTLQTYNVFGDLYCVKLPAGNGLEHLYDDGGRLTAIVRGRAVAEPSRVSCLETSQLRERTLWSLDTYGHRKSERLDRTVTSTWPTDPAAETAYRYATRCQLVEVVQAPNVLDATTEYDYQDCAGNLTHVWDAEHPRASHPASTIYEYDALDRLVTVRQRWGGVGPATEALTTYGYDVQDHLIAVTDAEGNDTVYVFSDRDRLTSQQSVASGTTTYRYDEHGELVEQTDARGAVARRAVDAADRVTFIDFPGDAIDIAYTYGSAPDPVDFTFGRLAEIVRDPIGAEPIVTSYRYDRFGRLKQDGELAHTFDANGNVLTTAYPGGVAASWSYDALDRPVSLAVDSGSGPVSVVSGVTYEPQGPLASLTFETSPTRSETRSFDRRYAPESIAVSNGLLEWSYATDGIGNVLGIVQTQPTPVARSFGYQEFQYYLTEASGPWVGPLAWSYDRIGNRLSESRDAATDNYAYLPNGASGNTPLLDQVTLASLGTREYAFDAAGHLDELAAGANTLDFLFDAEGRLASADRTAESFVDFRYDGRGYLAEVVATSPAFLGWEPRAPATTIFADDFETADVCEWSLAVGWDGTACEQPPVETRLVPVYDSNGRLEALFSDGDPSEGRYVFYLGDRPVATLRRDVDPIWTFLTTDPLGTPIHAMNATGTTTWLGGFEPFGRDWQSGAASASANGVFLRLPGQWIDPAWEGATLGSELVYNLYRWYETATARFASADSVTLGQLETSEAKGRFGVWGARRLATARALRPELEGRYIYASGNPITYSDPDGNASILAPWLWLAWWSEVLVCEQEVETCRLWCYTNQCDRCRPAPRGRDADYGRIFAENSCRSNCSAFCEYETSCWWKTIRRPLLWAGGRLLRGVR